MKAYLAWVRALGRARTPYSNTVMDRVDRWLHPAGVWYVFVVFPVLVVVVCIVGFIAYLGGW